MTEIGLATLIGLAIGVALAWGVASSRGRRLRRLGDRVATEIEPLLRRRAAEVGIDCERPVWNKRHGAAEKVDFSADLASKLLDQARGKDPAHSSTALAQTVPAVDSEADQAPGAPRSRTTPERTDEDRP